MTAVTVSDTQSSDSGAARKQIPAEIFCCYRTDLGDRDRTQIGMIWAVTTPCSDHHVTADLSHDD